VAVTAFAPARVNLIGEHTDYNEGLALPFAIPLGVSVKAKATDDRRVVVTALDLAESDHFSIDRPGAADGWRAFVRGAVVELGAAGFELSGARVSITGSVPRGAGLASSAALEVALSLALLTATSAQAPDRLLLARLCARVENRWAGADTGLLDQIASLFCQEEHALRIDFRSLDMQQVPLHLDGWSFALIHSGAERVVAHTGYNRRRAECRHAVELLGAASMRDVTRQDASRLPEPLNRRALHVIEENERVDAAVSCLAAGDVAAIGPLLSASHRSLSDLFEVSTPAVEDTVTRLRQQGAAGARMIGGGFGGQVLALFPPRLKPPADALKVTPAHCAYVTRI
jgi:galactokinase